MFLLYLHKGVEEIPGQSSLYALIRLNRSSPHLTSTHITGILTACQCKAVWESKFRLPFTLQESYGKSMDYTPQNAMQPRAQPASYQEYKVYRQYLFQKGTDLDVAAAGKTSCTEDWKGGEFGVWGSRGVW